MPTIRQLPVGLVNKIAAGEVIERPASVVKELLENCIDAGAESIEVLVEGGGIDTIRISDTGCGIDADQLELALAPHATSKLQSSDDLFDVRTLGFRGEALASIAEISHMVLRSRTADSDSGYELRAQGGEREPVRPCAMDVGTTVEIRNLFFNTPVRRKFLKAPQTEMGHVIEAFARIALANPHVRMVLQSNDRMLHDLSPTTRWADRIRAFFGDEIADALIAVDHDDEKVKIRGYVTDPSVSRGNNRMQYLFLNGRYIRDRALQHALGEAYRGLLMVGRMPVCFLHLELDPKIVDVNVHPTKVEVRFEDSGAIYSRLLHTLRHKFLSTSLVAKVRDEREHAAAGMAVVPGMPAGPIGMAGNELMTWARRQSAGSDEGPGGVAVMAHALPASRGIPTHGDPFGRAIPDFQPYPDQGARWDPFGPLPGPSSSVPASPESTLLPESSLVEVQPGESRVRFDAALPSNGSFPSDDSIQGSTRPTGFQVHDRYLVTQDDAGMVIIDQHALHERILYEQIKNKVLSKSLEMQRLLVPEPVSLTSAEAAVALDAKGMLAEIGIEIEPFGGDTVLVTSYPSMLSTMSPSEMLRQILEALMSGSKKVNARDVLDDIMNMMACKAAIKAGDRLTPDEISSLLAQRACYQDTHHCPHGRPTALFFSREQLDKMFKRT